MTSNDYNKQFLLSLIFVQFFRPPAQGAGPTAPEQEAGPRVQGTGPLAQGVGPPVQGARPPLGK